MLRALHDLPRSVAQQIRLLQCLEAEVVEVVVAIVLDVGVELGGIGRDKLYQPLIEIGHRLSGFGNRLLAEDLHHLRVMGLRILVMIAHDNTAGQDTPVRVLSTERCGHLCRELIKLRSLDAIDDAGQDLLGQNIRIDSETTCGLTNAEKNLVKADILTLTVALEDLHTIRHLRVLGTGLYRKGGGIRAAILPCRVPLPLKILTQ